jgi:hypothetical protein
MLWIIHGRLLTIKAPPYFKPVTGPYTISASTTTIQYTHGLAIDQPVSVIRTENSKAPEIVGCE